MNADSLPAGETERERPAPSAGTVVRQRDAILAMQQFAVFPPRCVAIQILFEYDDQSRLAGCVNRRRDEGLPISTRCRLAWRHLLAAITVLWTVPANASDPAHQASPEAK